MPVGSDHPPSHRAALRAPPSHRQGNQVGSFLTAEPEGLVGVVEIIVAQPEFHHGCSGWFEVKIRPWTIRSPLGEPPAAVAWI